MSLGSSYRRALPVAVLLALAAAPLSAVVRKESRGPLDDLAFNRPELRVTVTLEDSTNVPELPEQAAVAAFRNENGGAWRFVVDRRAGRIHLADGGAIPFLPGAANSLRPADFGASCREAGCTSAETAEALARGFLQRHRGVFGIDPKDLVADPLGSNAVGDSIRMIRFGWSHGGVPVRDSSVYFVVNNGNLVQIGVSNVGHIALDPRPRLERHSAWDVLASYLAAEAPRPDDEIVEKGALEILPITPRGSDPEVYNGHFGGMLDFALVWRFSFRRKGVPGTWEALVDAESGDLLRFADSNRYGHIHGGIRPSDGLPPEEDRPFPGANTGLGAPNDFTDAAGNFPGNNATTTLTGKYCHIADACGPISATTTTGDIDFKSGAAGTDCTVPTGNTFGAGNTKSSRTLFYNVSNLNVRAQVWNPSNTWLKNTFVTCNVNGAASCNASSGGGVINFYKAVAGSCNNLGEIPGVAMHEWGHSYDGNDGSGGLTPPVETWADWIAIMSTHLSCTGAGFFVSGNCSGYSDPCNSCTGIRDADYTKHQKNTPWRSSNNGPVYSCSSGSYNGPCGWEDHCESGIATQALWDFVTKDLVQTCPGGPMCTPAGFSPLTLDSAWMLEDRLWFSGVSTLTTFYTCAAAVTSGCGAGTLYTIMKAFDDDGDGTANGTPHAAAIFSALNRHGLACGLVSDATNTNEKDPGCPTMTIGTLSSAAGSNQVTLTWPAVTGATRYWVYRNEANCSAGFTRIAVVNAPTTTYVDNGVVNGITYYYRLQAATASDSCTSDVSNCATVTPQPCAGSVSVAKPLYSCSATVNVTMLDSTPGTSPWTVVAFSSTDATQKTITLANNPPGSAIYTGSFTTTTGAAGPTQVRVSHGDTLTVRYTDPDWCGTGANSVTATATIDCAPPVISSVLATSITDSSAVITWSTDEPANSRVTWGASTPPGTNVDDLLTYGTSHSILVTGLTPCTPYFFSVTSADVAGNSATATNGGAYYTFTTAGRSFAMGPDNVEGGVSSWTASGTAGSIWHRDTCKANSPTNAWKAGAPAGTCPGAYGNTVDTYLTWGVNINLGAAGHGYHFRFRENFDSESGFDFLHPQVSVNAGVAWTDAVAAYAGNSGGWVLRDIDLAAYTGNQVRVRFWFHSDGTVTGEGWYVDDIDISRSQACGADPRFLSLTRTDTCSAGGPGNANGVLEPGEDSQLVVTLVNGGMVAATNVSATLTSPTPGITVTDGSATFPNLPANFGTGGSQPNHYSIRVDPTFACATNASFLLHAVSTEIPAGVDSGFTLPVGQAAAPVTVFAENFSTVTPPALPAGWTISKTSGNDWNTAAAGCTDNALRYPYNTTQAANSWAYTPGIALTAGVTYTVNYNQKVRSASFPENYELKAGTAATPAGQTIAIQSFSGLTNTTCTTRNPTFTVPANGTYYLGWHCTSALDEWDLSIDDINVTYLQAAACNVCNSVPQYALAYDSSFTPTLAQVCGDGDAVVEPGEQWNVTIRLKNTGTSPVTLAVATLAVDAGSAVSATITGNPGSFGTVAGGGGTATAQFGFTVSSAATCLANLVFDVTGVSAAEGSFPSAVPAFQVPIGAALPPLTENATQTTTPLTAISATATSTLTPATTLTSPTSATLSWSNAFTPLPGLGTVLFGPDDMTATIGNWTAAGAAWNAGAAHCAPHTNGLALLTSTGAQITLTTGVSTVGATNVHVKFDYKHSNAANSLVLEWLNGAVWTSAQTFTGSNAQVCNQDVTLPAGANGLASLQIRFRITVTGTRTTTIDYVSIVADKPVGSWTGNVRVELIDPSATATVLKAYGAADTSPVTLGTLYTGPGTYSLRIAENAGGTATMTAGALALSKNQPANCAVSSCTGPPAEVAPGTSQATAQTWPNKNTNAWPAVSGATGYKLYRGTAADLSKLLNSSIDSCLRWTGAGTSSSVLTEDPASAGGLYWYIVTGTNGFGEGPVGNTSSGPRILDSSGVCP